MAGTAAVATSVPQIMLQPPAAPQVRLRRNESNRLRRIFPTNVSTTAVLASVVIPHPSRRGDCLYAFVVSQNAARRTLFRSTFAGPWFRIVMTDFAPATLVSREPLDSMTYGLSL
jgi:hypothetical protein